MLAVTTLVNGRLSAADPPASRVCVYLSALMASSPRTAYSTWRTAWLMVSSVSAFLCGDDGDDDDDDDDDDDVGLALEGLAEAVLDAALSGILDRVELMDRT